MRTALCGVRRPANDRFRRKQPPTTNRATVGDYRQAVCPSIERFSLSCSREINHFHDDGVKSVSSTLHTLSIITSKPLTRACQIPMSPKSVSALAESPWPECAPAARVGRGDGFLPQPQRVNAQARVLSYPLRLCRGRGLVRSGGNIIWNLSHFS